MAGWANLTLVTDAEIGQIEPQAISPVEPAPWGDRAWPGARMEAKRELKIWLEAAFHDIPNVADRIVDLHGADWVFASENAGASFRNVTVAANDDHEQDLDLQQIFATTHGRLYVGAAYQYEGLFVRLLDQLNTAQQCTLTVKYWGPGGWKTLTVNNGTSVAGCAFAQAGRITWTIPGDWYPRRLHHTGDEYFWVELSLSGALSAACTASQILPIRAPDGLKRVACYLALHFILSGLALQAGDPHVWEQKARDYYKKAEQLFAHLKNVGGIPIDVNRDQRTSPAELRQTAPLRMGRA